MLSRSSTKSSVAFKRLLVSHNCFELSTRMPPNMSFARYFGVVPWLSMASLVPASPAPQILGDVGSLIDNLPILNYPPQSIVTTDISPECANLNQGTRLCCESTLDGDVPLVVELATIIGYRLATGSINGIYCMFLPLQIFRVYANSFRQERLCLWEGYGSLLSGDYFHPGKSVRQFASICYKCKSNNLSRLFPTS